MPASKPELAAALAHPSPVHAAAAFGDVFLDLIAHAVEWYPKVRQPVKAQFSSNGEKSHEPRSKEVHQRI